MAEIVEMTFEEKAEFEAFKERKAADARKLQEKENRDAYKQLVDETINNLFPGLQELSNQLAARKTEVYDSFHGALTMKSELYKVSPEQRSNTFTNTECTRRIILGQHSIDAYDDTVNEGIAKVKQFIGSLAKDSESRMLVEAIMKLLSRDQKGNLKASRVMQLRKMANDSGNGEFLDGVRIIEESYRPEVSKYYVRAEFKNEQGEWVNVPLGMTEA